MKIIIEQEDVGKEISQLGLMLIEKKSAYELAIQYPNNNVSEKLILKHQELMKNIGTTPAGATVRIKRPYKKRAKK